MKIAFAIVTLTAVCLSCGDARAQLGGISTSPLNAATPLALGPSAPVGPTGVPLGSTELAAPGISPAPLSTMGCSTVAGSTSQTATGPFDGGGMASGACTAIGGPGLGTAGAGGSMPTVSALQAGRANIPLGSTELDSPGLSPLPPVTTVITPPIVPSNSSPLSTATTVGPPLPIAPLPCPTPLVTFYASTPRGQRSASPSTGASGGPGC